MVTRSEAKKVTIYVGSSDTWAGRNLALAIVERCRAEGIAGATVSRGMMGFGMHSRIHRAHLLGLYEDLPERIEIVDRADRIEQLIPSLQAMVDGGLILIQDIEVVHYEAHSGAGGMPEQVS
jgi:PII-like signaling protein